MRYRTEIANNAAAIKAAIEGVARSALGTIPERYLQTPIWYFAVYRKERRRAREPEHWKRPIQTLRDRAGDCEDFVIYEFVRLSALGIPALIAVRRNESGNFHTYLEFPSGQKYDPALLAYQREHGGFMQEPIEVGLIPEVGHDGRHFIQGYVTLRMADGSTVDVRAKGRDRVSALRKVTHIAQQITDSPLGVLLPPGTSAAVKVASAVAKGDLAPVAKLAAKAPNLVKKVTGLLKGLF